MRYVAVLVTMPVLLPFPEVNKIYEILYIVLRGHGILNGLGKKRKKGNRTCMGGMKSE
jgi:hypothetical protein